VQAHVAFTSPKVRARDTALLACEALGCEPIVDDRLAAGFDRDDALELLTTAGPDQRVLVVGHEPDFSQVVYDFTGARVQLKKGGVAAIRLDGTRAELIALLRPRELDRIREG
jgi:phosphohistidine phosphatase